MNEVGNRNHALWLGPLVTLVGTLSYFLVFARFAPLRDFPWLNLPLVLVGLAVSTLGLWRAFARPGRFRGRILGSVGFAVSLALTSLFSAYVFVFSYWLPGPTGVTRELDEAPAFNLLDQNERPTTLHELRGRKVVLVFYRGFW